MKRCCNVWFNPATDKYLFYPNTTAKQKLTTKKSLANLGFEHSYTVEIPEEIYKKMLDKMPNL